MGNEPTGEINLVGERDFALGHLKIVPSSCQIEFPMGERQRVEPRVMEVLVTFARAGSGTVSRERLIESCWGGRVVTDDAVTRALAKLRRAGEGYFEIETIPRVGFRLSVVSVERPVAGSAPGAGAVDPPTAANAGAAPARVRAVLAFAVLLALSLLAILLRRESHPGPERPEVVVAPFTSDSADADAKWLAASSQAAAVRYLLASGVTPIVSPRAAEDAGGLTLAVSVARLGEGFQLRGTVTAQGFQQPVWSFALDRQSALGLDSETGRMIAITISCALDDRTHSGGGLDPSSLSLIFGACDRWAEDGVQPARRLVAAMPTNARAHAQLAFAIADLAERYDYDVPALSSEAIREAEAALRLDRHEVLALLALGKRLGPSARWQQREEALRQVLQIDPANVDAKLELVSIYREVGRVSEARELAEQVSESGSPKDYRAAVPLAFLDAQTGHSKAAQEALAVLTNAQSDHGTAARESIEFWWGDPTSTQERLKSGSFSVFAPEQQACLADVLSADYGRVTDLPPNCPKMDFDWQIRLFARVGAVDAAFALLNGPWPNSRSWTIFLFYPETAVLRSDPRFPALLDRLGLKAYWQASSHWPDACLAASPPSWCPSGHRVDVRP